MEASKKPIDWSSLWRKDDWMAIWIGFLIIILTLAGFKLVSINFKWTTNSEFLTFASKQIPAVEKLVLDAETKNELPVLEGLSELKTALASGNRNMSSAAVIKTEDLIKLSKDDSFKKKAGPILKNIKTQSGAYINKVFTTDNYLSAFYIFLFLWILAVIGAALMKIGAGKFAIGFPVIFFIAFIAQIIAGNYTANYLGLEYVIWCLIIGLIISNTIGTPKWLIPAVRTEYFIKTGLVILGSGILFGEIVQAGSYGMIQAILVVFVVWYTCYWLCRKLKVDEDLSAILASGVSICGVSAAIATAGAVKGDPKKLSYVTSIILVCAVPMMVIMPWIIKSTGMDPLVGGAWLGGTLDTSGSVVAAGSLVSEATMKIGVIVKMSQNVLIGLVAFILAVLWAFKSSGQGSRPSAMEIWYRFPKFVLGFIIASLIFSFLLDAKTVSSVKGQLGALRTWWFSLAFVCIGLETRFKDLFNMGGGRPALAFLGAQTFNIFWTLLLSYLLFSGVFFAAPKF